MRQDIKQLRIIILAAPVAVVSSYILYKRLVLGEEQRRIDPNMAHQRIGDNFKTDQTRPAPKKFPQ
ncbi:hypothetical protein FRB94_006098 [Tulasnella sp. JGI-2019a]|nr:hypothetical protein FRB93_013251 [Tulasnella sp. JGI-2019a]KAG8999586.1 hypothetical protein FRB94_006098 [Tulasnella sp. JGI-2019a]KAG9022651.1 hypothetical protein FRB95_014503 [Tulasnella sp. JGI-2019a]